MPLYTVTQTSVMMNELNRWEADDILVLVDLIRAAGEDEVADKIIFLRMCGKLSKKKIELVAYSTIHPRSRFVLHLMKPSAKQGSRFTGMPRKHGKQEHEIRQFPRKRKSEYVAVY